MAQKTYYYLWQIYQKYIIISTSMKERVDRSRNKGFGGLLGFAKVKTTANRSADWGFTTIELLIATTVFSVVLLLTLTGFFQIGQTFYSGVAQTQTSAAAKNILTSISEDIKFAPTVVPKTAIDAGGSPSGPFFLCLGNARYTFNLFTQLGADEENLKDPKNPQHFGLLRDSLPGNGCAPYTTAQLNNPQELLGAKMRLSALDISPTVALDGSSVENLWTLRIKVAYGDDSALQSAGDDQAACNTSVKTSQYCAVTELSSLAAKGFQ